jgi:hypothetical protein
VAHLRKDNAGSTSTGYVWPHDGAVVEVDDQHAHELLAIQDAGFSLVAAPEPVVEAPTGGRRRRADDAE